MNIYIKRYEKEERRMRKTHPHIRKQYRKARYRKAASRLDLYENMLLLNIPLDEGELFLYEPWLY